MAPSPSRSSALIARVAAAGNSTRSKRNPPRFHSSVTGARSPARAMSIRPSPSRSANATPAPLPSNICGGSPSISVAWGRSWRTNPPLHAGATAQAVCATSTGTTSAPAAPAASRPASAMAAPTAPGAAGARATRPSSPWRNTGCIRAALSLRRRVPPRAAERPGRPLQRFTTLAMVPHTRSGGHRLQVRKVRWAPGLVTVRELDYSEGATPFADGALESARP